MQKHFTDERWSDYVRGVLPAAETGPINDHLEAGCELCQGSFRLWRTVAEVAHNEARNEVPDGHLRTSLASYIEWWRRNLLPQRARMARLAFDSLFEPLPVGVRSEGPSPRRILGRAGQWSLDLRFDPSAGNHLFLTGQILGPDQPHAEQVGLPVLLMSTDTLLAETAANQFGEFQLQFERANGLRIYAELPGRRPIGMSLPDLDSPSPAEETPID